MKKILAFILSAALLTALLCGCTETNPVDGTETASPETVSTNILPRSEEAAAWASENIEKNDTDEDIRYASDICETNGRVYLAVDHWTTDHIVSKTNYILECYSENGEKTVLFNHRATVGDPGDGGRDLILVENEGDLLLVFQNMFVTRTLFGRGTLTITYESGDKEVLDYTGCDDYYCADGGACVSGYTNMYIHPCRTDTPIKSIVLETLGRERDGESGYKVLFVIENNEITGYIKTVGCFGEIENPRFYSYTGGAGNSASDYYDISSDGTVTAKNAGNSSDASGEEGETTQIENDSSEWQQIKALIDKYFSWQSKTVLTLDCEDSDGIFEDNIDNYIHRMSVRSFYRTRYWDFEVVNEYEYSLGGITITEQNDIYTVSLNAVIIFHIVIPSSFDNHMSDDYVFTVVKNNGEYLIQSVTTTDSRYASNTARERAEELSESGTADKSSVDTAFSEIDERNAELARFSRDNDHPGLLIPDLELPLPLSEEETAQILEVYSEE